MKKASLRRQGFTLIELIIVMSIMAALATVFVATFPRLRMTARDAQRRSDIKQFQTALEATANRNNGNYESRTTAQSTGLNLCTDLGLTNCPNDPSGSPRVYSYISNGSGSGTPDATQYVLWAVLERPASPVTNFIICSSGKTGTTTGAYAPLNSNCPLP